MKHVLSVAVATTLGLTSLASSANAVDTTIKFTSDLSFGFSGAITFDMATYPNTSGVLVTGASGNYCLHASCYTVTGVDTNLGDANQDNKLFSSAKNRFDLFGVALTSEDSNFNPGPYLHFVGVGLDQTDAAVAVPNVSVVVGTVSTVPEPATWAMMLVGFGAFGIAARRRRERRLQTA